MGQGKKVSVYAGKGATKVRTQRNAGVRERIAAGGAKVPRLKRDRLAFYRSQISNTTLKGTLKKKA